MAAGITVELFGFFVHLHEAAAIDVEGDDRFRRGLELDAIAGLAHEAGLFGFHALGDVHDDASQQGASPAGLLVTARHSNHLISPVVGRTMRNRRACAWPS